VAKNGHVGGSLSEIDILTVLYHNVMYMVAVIANTVKGKGVSFMEHQYVWHGNTIAHPRANVKLNGSYGGLPTGGAGATHSSFEDLNTALAKKKFSA
jgi:transketolase